ncbi:MAG: diguanylate cyclase [Candidatus Eremiobacterota bacterium]
MNWSIGKKFGLGFAVTLAVLLVIGVVTVISLDSLVRELRTMSDTRGTLLAVARLETDLLAAESAARGYALSGDASYLIPLDSARGPIRDHLRQIERDLGKDPLYESMVPRLRDLVQRRLDRLEALTRVARTGKIEDVQSHIRTGEGKRLMDQFRSVVGEITATRNAEFDQRRRSAEKNVVLALTTFAAEMLLALLVVLVLGGLLVRDLTRPLFRLVECTERLRGGELSCRVEAISSDEIGRLGRAFNRLAEELERSKSEQLTIQSALQESNAQLAVQVEGLNRRNQEIERLTRLSELLQTTESGTEANSYIARLAPLIAPGSSGALYIVSASRNFVEPAALWGGGGLDRVFAPGDCLGLRLGRIHDPAVDHGECAHLAGASTQTACMPLLADGEAFGLLCLAPPEGVGLDRQLAVALAEQLSLALGNMRLREKLRNQSIRDPLTGLFNRRYMEESLERELFRSRRQSEPLSVLMIDIDHFKRFNDTYGHEAGDAVLRILGHFLKSHVRAEDIPCRYGGEEIALILPGAGLEIAGTRAEALRAGAESLSASHDGKALGAVTLSIGVACFPDHGSEADEVLARADQALYRAKHGGRNRVELAAT